MTNSTEAAGHQVYFRYLKSLFDYFVHVTACNLQVNDFVLKFLAVLAKVAVTLLPASILPYQKRVFKQ